MLGVRGVKGLCCTRCKIGFGFSGLGSVALGARGQGFVLHAVFGFGSGECVALGARGQGLPRGAWASNRYETRSNISRGEASRVA